MTRAALAFGITALLVPNAAFAASHLVVTQTFRAVDTTGAAADQTTIHMPDSRALHGEQVHFSVVAMNDGDRPVFTATASEGIGRDQHIVLSSLGRNAQVSIDHGRTWSFALRNNVAPSRINAVRWVLSKPLAAGASHTFSYDTIVE